MAKRDKPFRAVIVLGGGAGVTQQQTKELNREGERIFSAAQLWHAGLVSSVICTGSTPSSAEHPRDISAELLQSVGVPTEVIFKAPGENTIQEMQALKEFLEAPPSGFPESGEIGLITSAFHMRRAMRLASAKDLDFHPLPCGYRRAYRGFSPKALIPDADAVAVFGSAFKEKLASLVGR